MFAYECVKRDAGCRYVGYWATGGDSMVRSNAYIQMRRSIFATRMPPPDTLSPGIL